jgi:hypothetical protein
MRCKVRLTEITKYENNGYRVKYTAVSSGSPENEQFFKWTPSATIDLGVLNEKAVEGLVVGGEYYIDFTKAI